MINEEEQIDLEEAVAAIIFDYENDPDYVRPSEQTCKAISLQIIRLFSVFLKNKEEELFA